MKSIGKRLAGCWPSWVIAILFGPMYKPTPEESARYWNEKMNSELGIDARVLYGPEDHWWHGAQRSNRPNKPISA